MTENVAEVSQEEKDNAEMEAAFNEATSNNAAEPVAEPAKPADAAKETPTKTEEVKQENKATPTAPPVPANLSEDQVKLLSAIPELEARLMQQMGKVAGNYGEIKRLFDAAQKAAATPQGAAAFNASSDGDYLDKEFPEWASGIDARIGKAVSKLPAGITAQQFEAMYVQRRTQEDTTKRNEMIQVLHSAHPDRFEIQKTPQWTQWVEGLRADQRSALNNSEDPYYVSGMLSKFKVYRDKQAVASTKSQQRIESAITPTGVRPTGPSTVSEDEAVQKAFDDQFK